MKHLFLILVSALINTSFAQETDFFQKLDFLDLVFYQKEVSFNIQISGNTQETYKGSFKISSNRYEIENCTLKEQTPPNKKDISQIKDLLKFGVLTSNAMYRALYSYKAHNVGKYKASYFSENTWKLICADKATRNKMQLDENDNCYFLITLDNDGYITQIKSIIEGKREDTVHYVTGKLSPEDAQALGGEMAKVFVGNSLVTYFTDIEGKVLNSQSGNTLHFQFKTK
jgi:hypothetical protein